MADPHPQWCQVVQRSPPPPLPPSPHRLPCCPRSAAFQEEAVIAQRAPGVAPLNITGPADVAFLSAFKHRSDCAGANQSCASGGASAAVPMVRALRGQHGRVRGPDYRRAEVLAAHDYLPALRMGLVVKVDTVEVEAPALEATVRLFLMALGAVCVFVVLLTVILKRLLDSMERAWTQV